MATYREFVMPACTNVSEVYKVLLFSIQVNTSIAAVQKSKERNHQQHQTNPVDKLEWVCKAVLRLQHVVSVIEVNTTNRIWGKATP